MELLLILDMINDLVHPDGPHGKTGFGPEVQRRNVVDKAAELLAKARAAGVPVGYVRIGFSPEYGECPADSSRFAKARENGWFKLGTWGTEVHEKLQPRSGDFDIVKHRVSPFYATTLQAILSANGIRKLYVAGVSTNAVVQAAMREAHDRDYSMVLVEDCCAALSANEHEAAIQTLEGFGVITTVNEVKFEKA